MKFYCVDALSLPCRTTLESTPQPVPIKRKKAKNSKKKSLKWLNTWQLSNSLRVFLVIFSRDQYWAQSYWKFSWMSGKLILNPVDKIFSSAMISSVLTMLRIEWSGDFSSLKQSKCKLLCLVSRDAGQVESGRCILESNDWNGWVGRLFTSLQGVSPSLACSRNRLTPSCILGGVHERGQVVVMLCGQLWSLLL